MRSNLLQKWRKCLFKLVGYSAISSVCHGVSDMSYRHNNPVFCGFSQNFALARKNCTNWLVLLARLFATLIQVVGNEYGLFVGPPGFVGDAFQFGKSPVFFQTVREKRVKIAEPRAGAPFSGAAQ